MPPYTYYIYGNIDFSSKSAGAKRMLYYAKTLADDNHKVYLVSCCSNKFTENDFVEIAPNIFRLEKLQISNTLYSAFKFLRRLHRFSISDKSASSFIVYPQSYFFLELFSVLYMILIKKHNLYYELNEVKKYSSIFHERLSILKPKYLIKTLVFKTKFVFMDGLMRNYRGLICISTNIEKYGKKYNKNTLRIPILTDPSNIPAKTNSNYVKNGLFNIGFSGSIVPSKENLFEFVEIIKKLNEKGYRVNFNLCGTITKENHRLLIKNEIDYISYHGNLDEKELSSFLLQQDLLVVPRGFTKQNKFGFSTKLSDYLNHKKIILVTDISDNALYIKDGLNGFIVRPNDPEMMYKQIIHVMGNFEKIEKLMVEKAFETSKTEFDYRLYKESLRTFLKSGEFKTTKTESLSNA